MIDFSILRLNFFSKECIVESLKVFCVRFEEYFGNLIEQGDKLVFWEYFFLLEGFLLFIFVVDLFKDMIEIGESEFVAEYASVKDEHENFWVLEWIGVSFGKVGNKLINALSFSLFELNLVWFHLILFSVWWTDKMDFLGFIFINITSF